MIRTCRFTARWRLKTPAACIAGILIAATASAAETPAKSWLGLWENVTSLGGSLARYTVARPFNPADPADPAAPDANVTVTYFQHDCWGPVAAKESQVIPPGQHGSFSTLFAGYPASLWGTGCLLIKSDAPIVPMNGHAEEWEVAREIDFWRTAKPASARWTSYWEHANALGGAALGGVSTSGWVLNPARQATRTEPLPPAHVTVTFYKGACGSSSLWKQETHTLGPGQFALYFSHLPAVDENVGAGCLFIASDQPVVPLNGEIRNAVQTVATAAMTFQAVDWNPAGVQP